MTDSNMTQAVQFQDEEFYIFFMSLSARFQLPSLCLGSFPAQWSIFKEFYLVKVSFVRLKAGLA